MKNFLITFKNNFSSFKFPLIFEEDFIFEKPERYKNWNITSMEDFLNLETKKLDQCASYDTVFLTALTDFSEYVLTTFFSNSYFHEVLIVHIFLILFIFSGINVHKAFLQKIVSICFEIN